MSLCTYAISSQGKCGELVFKEFVTIDETCVSKSIKTCHKNDELQCTCQAPPYDKATKTDQGCIFKLAKKSK